MDGRRVASCGSRWTRGLPSQARCLAELLLALAGTLPHTLAASAVDIAATVGFTDTFRPGHWTPLTVTVTSHEDELSGEREVQVTGDDALRGRMLVTSHRRTLELQRDSRKSMQFIVHLQGLSNSLVARRSCAHELAGTEIDLSRA